MRYDLSICRKKFGEIPWAHTPWNLKLRTFFADFLLIDCEETVQVWVLVICTT